MVELIEPAINKNEKIEEYINSQVLTDFEKIFKTINDMKSNIRNLNELSPKLDFI